MELTRTTAARVVATQLRKRISFLHSGFIQWTERHAVEVRPAAM